MGHDDWEYDKLDKDIPGVNTSSSTHSEKADALEDALWTFVPPVILLVGVFGNIMAFLVLFLRQVGKKTTRLLLVLLSMFDLLVLLTGLLRHWINAISGVDIRESSDAGCVIHKIIVYWSLQCAAFTLVLVSIDRLVVVCYPQHAHQICRVRNAAVTEFVFISLLLVLDALTFFEDRLQETDGGYECIWSKESALYWVLPYIDWALFSLIPLIIIVSCNVMMILKIQRTNSRRKNIVVKGSDHVRLSGVSRMLFTVNLMFFFTTLPISLLLIVDMELLGGRGKTPTDSHGIRIAFVVTSLVQYTNNAWNFYLYCIHSYQFRKELKIMFWPKWFDNGVYPANDQSLSPRRSIETRLDDPVVAEH
jgi:hypothetical protein